MAEIPLFPLPAVLFPGGKLPLQIFEQRYLDMVTNCMRDDVGFGIIMITEGSQVLSDSERQLPSVAQCGTYARIVDFDQRTDGVLQIMVEGELKFSLRNQHESAVKLMRGQVEFLPLEARDSVPDDKHHLVELLKSLAAHEAIKSLNLQFSPDIASDVGARLTELLPCPNEFKQRMLEMKDPLDRLVELEKELLRMQASRQ